MAADHRQDRRDGQRLERDEGDREHQADRQRAARRRPYPTRAARRRLGPGRICAHQGEGRTSTAVDVKNEQAGQGGGGDDGSGFARGCLITEHVPGRYAFHDLLRAYAAEQARRTDSDTGRREATSRVLDYYLHTAADAARLINPSLAPVVPPGSGAAADQPADREQALAWFEAEHQTLLAVLAFAAGSGSDTHAWQLPWAMGPFLQARGHWQEWAATQRTALAAATRLGDLAAQAPATPPAS